MHEGTGFELTGRYHYRVPLDDFKFITYEKYSSAMEPEKEDLYVEYNSEGIVKWFKIYNRKIGKFSQIQKEWKDSKDVLTDCNCLIIHFR